MKTNKQKIKALLKQYQSIQKKQCDPIEKEIRLLLKSEYPTLSTNDVIDWACDLISYCPVNEVLSRMDAIFKK